MQTLICFSLIAFCFPYVCNGEDLISHIEHVRKVCSGISDKMSDLKLKAGINTAITAVGTVSSGVALGTGIAKTKVDAEAEKLEAEIQDITEKLYDMSATQLYIDEIPEYDDEFVMEDDSDESDESDDAVNDIQNDLNTKKAELEKLTQKSKTLGNIRTGTLAGTAIADTASTIIAATNRVKGGLQSDIDDCAAATQELSVAYMQARMDNEDEMQLSYAENIVRECGAWKSVNLSKINDRATGAAVSSGIGAAMAITGTITSAVANTDKTRNDNSESGKKHEENLNIVSNVMAGGATVASGVATVFNATQISAIKRAATVADNCEKALKQ